VTSPRGGREARRRSGGKIKKGGKKGKTEGVQENSLESEKEKEKKRKKKRKGGGKKGGENRGSGGQEKERCGGWVKNFGSNYAKRVPIKHSTTDLEREWKNSGEQSVGTSGLMWGGELR